MEQSSEALGQPQTHTVGVGEQTGLYVYCVAAASEKVSLGGIGIDGREVHTVGCNDLCAVVHDCPAQPYDSQDPEVAAAWVLAHHQVVGAAWERWGTVLPLTFNTIIKGEPGRDAGACLLGWLEAEHEVLKAKLEALAGKAEYGVQVFWDPQVVARQVSQSDAGIRELEEEIRSKPRGIAYMYRQKLEAMLKKEIEARTEEECRELYGSLSRCADNIHVEKTKKDEAGRQMLMNLSCLVSAERYPHLETELSKISNREGFFVRLAGPLPPYSFC